MDPSQHNATTSELLDELVDIDEGLQNEIFESFTAGQISHKEFMTYMGTLNEWKRLTCGLMEIMKSLPGDLQP